jgi:DNA-binding protein H-NS
MSKIDIIPNLLQIKYLFHYMWNCAGDFCAPTRGASPPSRHTPNTVFEPSVESAMGKLDLESMNFEELWLLHERLTRILSERITAEKLELEKRLAQLNPKEEARQIDRTARGKRRRRKYPKVLPKYFNPLVPTETWSGRGKQPRWLVAALGSGHKLEEFRIADTEEAADSNRPRRSGRS